MCVVCRRWPHIGPAQIMTIRYGILCEYCLLFTSLIYVSYMIQLNQWIPMTHICVSKVTIIGSNNGLSPDRRQSIIWTNARMLLIWPLGTNFSEILIDIYISLFKTMHLKMSTKQWPLSLALNVLSSYLHMLPLSLTHQSRVTHICVGKLTIIGSDNGLSPGRRQAII